MDSGYDRGATQPFEPNVPSPQVVPQADLDNWSENDVLDDDLTQWTTVRLDDAPGLLRREMLELPHETNEAYATHDGLDTLTYDRSGAVWGVDSLQQVEAPGVLVAVSDAAYGFQVPPRDIIW